MAKSASYMARNRAGGSGGDYLPETITSTVMGRTIEGNTIIVKDAKGRTLKIEVNSYEEITDAKTRQITEKNMGLKDPVRIGRGATERAVAERAIEQGKQEKENYNKNMQKNVKGYDELKNAISHNEQEHEKFNRSLYSGSGKIYSEKKIDVSALKKKYPRASAYMEAESFFHSNNSTKISLGRDAMQEIRQGKPYKKAIQKMNKKWNEYTRSKALD